MIRAYTPQAIRRAEEPLLQAGVPLMQRAAHVIAVRCVQEIQARGQRVPGSEVLAVVGGGNNGADALYAAGILARRGLRVACALAGERVHEGGLVAARDAGVAVHRVVAGATFDRARLLSLARRAGVWIDAVAGIGAAGPLREPAAGLLAALQAEKAGSPDEPIVVAVDVPSGVAGECHGILSADVTVCLGGAKTGLLLPGAARYVGRLDVENLGIPLCEPASAYRLQAADVADIYPWPAASDHKYTRGVVRVFAGSASYPGARILADLGALCAGPGMVRDPGGASRPEIVAADGPAQAAVVGPGMLPEEGAAALQAAAELGVPVVVDAGALGALPALAGSFAVPPLATPHAGELARLRGVTSEAVLADPVGAARGLAAETGAVVLLKGSTTLVVPPKGSWASQRVAVPWLASAGSGDVLAGILGGLLALDAARHGTPGAERITLLAAAGAWLHAKAGERASGGGPVLAQDVALALPQVIAGLASK